MWKVDWSSWRSWFYSGTKFAPWSQIFFKNFEVKLAAGASKCRPKTDIRMHLVQNSDVHENPISKLKYNMHSLVVIIMWQWTSSHSENHYRIEHDRPSGIRFCVMLNLFWFMIIHCSLYGCCHGCHAMLLTVFHWQYHCDICDICDAWSQWHHHGHKETASEYSTMVTQHQKHSLSTGQYNPISHNSTYPWPLSPYNSNATVTWQQHWLCLHVGEQHPSQLCICWWNSMYPTQTPTTQHWSWFELYEQPPTWPLDLLCASVPISRKWWPSGKYQCQEELWISMAHTQRSRSPSKHSHHLHEWLNCLQPHASTLPRSNLGGLRTLSPINISSQCEYRHYPNIHFHHQNQ